MSNDMPEGVMGEDTNVGGCPSKLDDELIAKAEEYIYDFRSNDDIVPSVAGLACYLEISRSSVYNYKDKSNRFLDIVERVELLQEKMLINGGLKGDFNAAITKLMMAKRGYSDSQVVDNTSSDGSMSPTINNFNGDAQAASQAYQDIMGGK
ncbi:MULTISPECIES: DNA-packaging protein [Psychrobacter]|uniref:DNA-packaging protein n=1 Tax=Psychrobacter TaxID=497 RepID=UPI001D006687|nr:MULTISPECIES: DNA-packaging protein [Psychrobacter]